MSGDDWEQIATIEQLKGQTRISVVVDDTPALLIHLADLWYVVEDVCTHDGQPLGDGEITEGAIQCPRHGARFDVKTGAALCMPATQPLQIFEVSLREDGVYARPYSEQVLKDLRESQNAEADGGTAEIAETSEAKTSKSSESNPVAPGQSAPNETAMLDALKQVIDPELFVNIVDLGLVYDISKSEESENEVALTMTLTSPACPAGPQLISQAKSALEALPGIENAEIRMTMSPPWSPEMMTEEARDQLGIF